jgi:hypothetical protein
MTSILRLNGKSATHETQPLFNATNNGHRHPSKLTRPRACADCRHMKLNPLQKLHDAMLNLSLKSASPKTSAPEPKKTNLRMLELNC